VCVPLFAAESGDMAAAKAKRYTLGGEVFPSIYGTVGEREVAMAETGEENGVPYMAFIYKTGSIKEDIVTYVNKLGIFGWVITKTEGDYDEGAITIMDESKEPGKLLIITIELGGTAYKLNIARMEGKLTRNK
jgi:hypothetical protein